MPIDPPAAIQDARTLIESALTISNLVVAGILIGLAMRLPRRLDACNAGAMSSLEALRKTSGENPDKAGKRRAGWWWLVAVLLAALIALILSPARDFYPVIMVSTVSMMLVGGALSFIRRTESLHRAGLAAEETVALAVSPGFLTGLFPFMYGNSTANLLPTIACLVAGCGLLKLSFTIGSSSLFAGALLLPAFAIFLIWSDPTSTPWNSRRIVSPAVINSAAALCLTGLGIAFTALARAPAHPSPLHADLRQPQDWSA